MSAFLYFIFMIAYLLNISEGECVMWNYAYQAQALLTFFPSLSMF